LCISCGACKAVCPKGAVSMELKRGQFTPEINKDTCINCGICANVCPAQDILPEKLFAMTPSDIIFEQDNYIDCLNAYSLNADIRQNSTSGGLITGLLFELLKTGDCDCVFVVNFINFNGNQVYLEPTSMMTEVFSAAGSKYVPVSAQKAIEAIRKNPDKKYALVATPCVMEAVKKSLTFYKIADGNILYLGLFCHKTLNFNAVKYYEHKYRRIGEKLDKFSYRTKEKFGWPGYTKLRFSSGRKVFVHENERMLCKTFFQLNRCLYCLDKLNSQADISFGDGYLDSCSDPKGRSNIIIRTEKGKKVFDKYSWLFYCEPVDINEIKIPQNFHEERKERLKNAVIFARESGLNVPDTFSEIVAPYDEEKLSRLRKYISWGENKSFFKIKLKSALMNLKEKKSVIWYTDTFKFAVLFIIGLVVHFRKKTAKKPDTRDNIIIVGGELFNKGAQAMAFTTVDNLRRKFPGKRIYLFSKSDYERHETEKNRYNFDILPWDISLQARIVAPWSKFIFRDKTYAHLEDRIKNVIDNAYCIADISGFGLSSQFGDTKSFFYMMNIVTAKNSGVDFYAMPQSMGPFDYSRSRKLFLYPFMCIYLKYPKKIYLRENESISQAYYYTSANLSKSPDMVLLNTSYFLLNIYKSMPQFKALIAPADSVAVIPSMRVASQFEPDTVYNLYRDIICALLDAKRRVYLIRHSFEDLAICRKLKTIFLNDDKVVYLNDDFNCIELEKIIGQFDFIVASRYHSIIHAYKNGIPAFVIGWAVKYQELLETFGQSSYFFDARKNPDLSSMIESLKKIIAGFEEEKKRIIGVLNTVASTRSPFDCIPEDNRVLRRHKVPV